jgi:GxxExxY protein
LVNDTYEIESNTFYRKIIQILNRASEECLCFELKNRDIAYKRQQDLPINYKGNNLDCGYRLDLLIEDTLVVELKSCDHLLPVHEAQLLTYLKLTEKRIGLLINFNVPVLKDGIKRLIN